MKNNDIIVGLGFGDEGKGTITDWLCTQEQVNSVVRFSGGPQTAHNVITETGQHHTFAQFGSGTLRGVRTLLSRYMLVNPFNMVNEANHLYDLMDADPMETTLISGSALLITPLHVAVNQLREERRGASRHGSCGQGIGEARSYAIQHPVLALTMRDLTIHGFLAAKLDEYRLWAEQTFNTTLNVVPNEELMADYIRLQQERPVNIISDEQLLAEIRLGYNVFEGSQGVLLDEAKGFHPHTTWSDTTPNKAQQLLQEAGLERGNVVGITRTYHTRHGFGPFPSEDHSPDIEKTFPEAHNVYGHWQGGWRAGNLDLALLDYANRVVGGVDEIAITHLDTPVDSVITDYPDGKDLEVSDEKDLIHQETLTQLLNNRAGTGSTQTLSGDTEELTAIISQTVNAPVRVKSFGPTSADKEG
jgi:adenylosuccinate synthase